MSYKTTFSDGTNSIETDDDLDALDAIARHFGVATVDLVTSDDDDGRTLVWLSEDDAKDDDGAEAVAEIHEIKKLRAMVTTDSLIESIRRYRATGPDVPVYVEVSPGIGQEIGDMFLGRQELTEKPQAVVIFRLKPTPKTVSQ